MSLTQFHKKVTFYKRYISSIHHFINSETIENYYRCYKSLYIKKKHENGFY